MALAWWRPPVDVEALAQLVGDSSTSLLPCAHQGVACRVSLSLVASSPQRYRRYWTVHAPQ